MIKRRFRAVLCLKIKALRDTTFRDDQKIGTATVMDSKASPTQIHMECGQSGLAHVDTIHQSGVTDYKIHVTPRP